ncbi:MAG: dCTP deaminase, partial [Phycisphaerales bacterium]|nr:dCTP deaminase [Phycisphaerales bacterium]
MSVLADFQIRDQVKIEPFETAQKRPGRISFGVSSYGYDVRVGTHFKIFTPTPRTGDIAVVDPKSFSDDMMVEVDVATKPADKQYVIIPPNSFALCETVEYLEIPRGVLEICGGPSA